MPRGSGKSKCTFRRTFAPDPICSAELDAVERLLARFVALAYSDANADLFRTETLELSSEPALTPAAVPLSAQASSTEVAQYE